MGGFPGDSREPLVARAGALAADSPPASTSGVNDIKHRLHRRQLRALGKAWTLAEVKNHRSRYDCWIVVNNKVYDITEHVANHPGWHTAGISTPLSILAHR